MISLPPPAAVAGPDKANVRQIAEMAPMTSPFQERRPDFSVIILVLPIGPKKLFPWQAGPFALAYHESTLSIHARQQCGISILK
jgi:hypothetical protein